MKGKIKINPRCGIAYIPARLTKGGYIGIVETLENAVTVTLLKPDAPLAEVRNSLEVVLMDIDLRMKQENRTNNEHKG